MRAVRRLDMFTKPVLKTFRLSLSNKWPGSQEKARPGGGEFVGYGLGPRAPETLRATCCQIQRRKDPSLDMGDIGNLDGTSLEMPGMMNRDSKARRDEES